MARDSRRGSAMLESALSLTLLLTMLFGIIEFGRATWMYSLTSYLANEGARYAMVRGGASASPADAAAVSAYVRGLAVGVDPAALTVDTTWSPDNAPGSMVTVKVASSFHFNAPYMPGKTLALGSTAKITVAR